MEVKLKSFNKGKLWPIVYIYCISTMEPNSLYNAIANTPNTAGGGQRVNTNLLLYLNIPTGRQRSSIVHIAVIQCIQ